MEQSLSNRGDKEELIDTELGDQLPTTALPRMPLVYDLNSSVLIMQ